MRNVSLTCIFSFIADGPVEATTKDPNAPISTALPTTITQPTSKASTAQEVSAPGCTDRVGAILYYQPHLQTYIFTAGDVFILSPQLGIEVGPLPLHRVFRGVKHVDAAYVTPEEYIMLFSGTR